MLPAKIKRTPVESSNIKSIGYENKLLVVEFKNKKIYSYIPVSEETYKSFIASESKGGFFSEKIRKDQTLTVTQIK